MNDSMIDEEEVRRFGELLHRIVATSNAEARALLFVEGFSKFGSRFLSLLNADPGSDDSRVRQILDPLRTEAGEVAAMWLNGRDYLGTADEAERRALFGTSTLADNPDGARLLAKSILALPQTHPRRELVKARELLVRHVQASRRRRNPEGELFAIADLLSFDLVDRKAATRLFSRGEALLQLVGNEECLLQFAISVGGFCTLQARSMSVDEAVTWRKRACSIFERVECLGLSDGKRARSTYCRAILLYESGDVPTAIDAFARARSSGLLGHSTDLLAAELEARLRLGLPSQEQKVVELLTPIVDELEKVYLLAVERHAIESDGRSFAQVTIDLAFASAALDRWKDAALALERGKCRRMLHQVTLRRLSTKVTNFLEIEKQVYALGRGVEPTTSGEKLHRREDWLGADLSAHSRALEAYRRLQATIPVDLAAQRSIEAIANSLMPGEMALLLGLNFNGTMIAGIARGDRDTPSLQLLRPELTTDWLGMHLRGERSEGFIPTLELGELVCDPRPALDRLLAAIDSGLAESIATLLDGRGLNRLIIVPHSFYSLVPFWALPTLGRWEVVTVPSAAHFVALREAPLRPLRRALVVGDPTADLPISSAETRAVRHHLAAAGLKVVSVAPENATQREIVRAAVRCDVFHFCGHGRAELTNPERSALLLRPEWKQTPIAGPDDFDRIAANVTSWKRVDDEYSVADIAGIGRIVVYRNPDSGENEYFLEYSVDGTLWLRYLHDQRLQVAELWTTGDLIVQRALECCGLAFLSACSAGSGGVSELTEGSGLTGALLLAGVSTIVATQWPVSDVLSALYVDLFYAGLMSERGRRSVATVVTATAKALREMAREDAITRLGAIQRHVSDPFARFEIDAYKDKLESGEEFPFAHPYAWASFHVLGRPDVLIE